MCCYSAYCLLCYNYNSIVILTIISTGIKLKGYSDDRKLHSVRSVLTFTAQRYHLEVVPSLG